MEYSNAQILASVLSEWARPAISQIATSKLSNLPFVRSMQATVVSSGLVGHSYNIAAELLPFANNAVNVLIEPMLEKYFRQIPDEAIPRLAHSMVTTAMQQPSFSIFDGLVEFSQTDMLELKDLLDKNMPLGDQTENYKVIK